MAGLKNVLQIRTTQSQSQILTPQMQQAIGLLQLSTIELQQQIRQTVESNPMLEIDESSISSMEVSLDDLVDKENANEDDYNPYDNDNLDTDFYNQENQSTNNSLDFDKSLDLKTSNTKTDNDEYTDSYTDNDTNIDSDYSQDNSSNLFDLNQEPVSSQDSAQLSDSLSNLTSGIKQGKGLSIENDNIYEGETTETLQDHLTWQLELSPLNGKDKFIAKIIIDAVNDTGYLSDSTEDILQTVQKTYADTTHEEILAILKLIQHYDPLGVASRDVQECILIQLNDLPEDTEYKKEAILTVQNYFKLLSNRDYRVLCQKLSLKEDNLKKVIDLIISLNPKPGNCNFSKKDDFVIPDVIVVKDSHGNYSVQLNPASNINVRINESYRQLAAQAKTKDEKIFFKNHLQEANFFIQSLDKRNDTLLKVASCIVEHQKAFMEEGPSAMHPMVLNDVATIIQMHESTVSRITNEKYMYTPKGTFELKYFFSSSVSTEDGGQASSTAIKSLIKEYISKENPRKPLSDIKISDMLNQEGFNVARRTVAKYRESLGIASSSQRKQLV